MKMVKEELPVVLALLIISFIGYSMSFVLDMGYGSFVYLSRWTQQALLPATYGMSLAFHLFAIAWLFELRAEVKKCRLNCTQMGLDFSKELFRR